LGNRSEWSSAGFNGLNGNADFRLRNRPTPAARFEDNFGHLLQPWRTGGDYILLLGQVPGDASIRGVDMEKWYDDQITKLKKVDSRPVFFRAHPRASNAPRPAGAQVIGGTLAEAFDGAAFAVTYNSNSGVDAALAGVPVYALGQGSMASPVATEALCFGPWRPDRSQWAADLAWCQWTESEFRAGMTWDHLKYS